MEIVIKRREDVSDEDNQIILKLVHETFGDMVNKYEWAKPDWRLIGKIDNEISCCLELMERRVLAGDTQVKVAGIGNVITPPSFRGKGLAGKAMTEAMKFAKTQMEVDFGLLLCSEDLVPYYKKLGWELVNETLFFEQSTGRIKWWERVMVFPCTEKHWPTGEVDLCGAAW